uniref:Preprotein translocase subunit SecG n=1 Tax=Monodopsis sp. MarTras21 TaxID=1745953 RepID=A0A1D8RDK7_9STRA|nr:preprotein translocase subunit SecG [Monodopsis sp. MarTras21]
MSILLNIIFLSQALLLTILIISRNPARLPGFEKARNQSLDKTIILLVISLIIVMFGFKCR